MNAVARHLSPVRVFGLAILAALLWGFNAHLSDYITPTRGLGYWLGIIGGSMMLLLLLYPARKRASWLRAIGGVTAWFRLHMILGVLGPLLVLYHANFSLGATNSNVALVCMLMVSGSGVVGRYIYTRAYAGWSDHRSTLEELKSAAEQLHQQSSAVAVLPDLMGEIERTEKFIFKRAGNPLSVLLRPFIVGARSLYGRWQLEQAIRRMVVRAARATPALAPHGKRLADTAIGYGKRRLDAQRRVEEHQLYVRLFSLWHYAHVPFFLMLLVAGIVHVISVNVY